MEIAKILQAPDIRTKLTEMGVDTIGSTPEAFAAHVKVEPAKWTDIIRATGAKTE